MKKGRVLINSFIIKRGVSETETVKFIHKPEGPVVILSDDDLDFIYNVARPLVEKMRQLETEDARERDIICIKLMRAIRERAFLGVDAPARTEEERKIFIDYGTMIVVADSRDYSKMYNWSVDGAVLFRIEGLVVQLEVLFPGISEELEENGLVISYYCDQPDLIYLTVICKKREFVEVMSQAIIDEVCSRFRDQLLDVSMELGYYLLDLMLNDPAIHIKDKSVLKKDKDVLAGIAKIKKLREFGIIFDYILTACQRLVYIVYGRAACLAIKMRTRLRNRTLKKRL